MKRILSILLAIVMIIGMLPMTMLTASAADKQIVFEFGANGTATHADGTSKTTYTETNEGYTLTLTNVSNFYTGARDAKGNSCIKLGASSKTGGFSFTVPADVTKVVINASGYKDKTVTVKVNGASHALTTKSNNGAYTAIEVDTTETKEVTLVTSTGNRAMVNSITFVCKDTSADCAHANITTVEQVEATCTAVGYTAGVFCNDCNTYTEGHEEIAALGHKETAVVTDPTCTEAGFTTYTCSVCNNVRTGDTVAANGHTFEGDTCVDCGVVKMNLSKASSIEVGNVVVFVCEDKSMEMNGFYLEGSKPYAYGAAYTDAPLGLNAWTVVAGSAEGTYAFEMDGAYLCWTSENSVKTSNAVDSNSSWTVSFDENGNAIVTNAADESRNLRWNATSPRFACYTSAQTAIQLYVIANGEVEPEVPTDPTDPVDPSEPETEPTVPETEPTVPSEPETEPTVPETEPTEPEVTEPEVEPSEPVVSTATISFADTTQRVSQDNDSQVWRNGDLTVTNNKAASTTNVANYCNPVRFYKSSEIIIAYPQMTKIVINSATNDGTTASKQYFTNLVKDLETGSVTTEGTTITVQLDDPVDTYTITLTGGQARWYSITVTSEKGGCDHVWGEWGTITEATCTTTGLQTATCTLCGDTKTQSIAATGHTYTYTDTAITCANCDYNQAYTLSTIEAINAAGSVLANETSSSETYYAKGIVTYVSGKNVYLEDATGGFCVYFGTAPEGIALGDEYLVWGKAYNYNGLIEFSGTTAQQCVKGSSGNTLPSKVVTIADLKADTANTYLGERVVIENVTMGVINGSGNTELTDANGNSINIYKVSGLNEAINLNDIVTVTAIVSSYNGYQLVVNPGTAAADVVEVEHHDEVVVSTITIAEAKAGTAGEYYQVEGVVTFIDGRNVYIQDATGGIVVYLTANNTTAAIGDKVKAYGALKQYNGLIELDGIAQDNTDQFEVLSNGNTVDAQAVTIADLKADTTNEYLAEKVTLTNVYVSYSYDFSASYKNVTYVLKDGDATIVLYRAPAETEETVMAGGTIVNVEAIVSSRNGYQLRVVGAESIEVVGACTHETTELVGKVDATCTTAGHTGNTECVACGNYVAKGEEIPAQGHNADNNGACSYCGETAVAVIGDVYYVDFATAVAAANGAEIKLLADIELAELALSANLFVDVNGHVCLVEGVAGAYTVTVKDSATADYKTLGVLVSFVGDEVDLKAADGYLMTEEENGDGYFFDAYKLAITHVSLDANKDALGYKAELKGNERVQSAVTSYGFVMGVVGREGKEYKATGNIDDGVFTLRLSNIMKYRAGEKEIVASAFVVFNEDTENKVSTEQYTTSMKATLLAVNEIFDDLSETQKASVQKLYGQYETVIVKWLEGKINNFAPVSDVVPSEPETPAE